MTLRLDVFHRLDDIRQERENWSQLLKKSGTESIFLSYEWIISWLEIFGSDGEILILKAEQDGQWQALFPLILKKSRFLFWRVHAITFIGAPYSDRSDFLISGDYDPVIAAVLEFFRHTFTKWDIMLLREIPSLSPTVNYLEKQLKICRLSYHLHTCGVSPYIRLEGSWTQYLASRSRKFRKKIRKNFRSLEKKEGPVKMVKQPFNHASWKILLDISRQSSKHKKGIAFLEQPRAAQFMQKLLTRFQSNDWLDLNFLYAGKRVVAYEINFKYHDRRLSYDCAFNDAYAGFSPGHLLEALIVEDCFQQGCQEMDLLRGGEQYKFRWTDKAVEQCEFIIYNRGFYGALLRLSFMVKEALKRIRKHPG